MSSLLVAAGGGGDALGALVVHRLLDEPGPPAAVMTFAWERLRVDPIPGPRSIADFRGLTNIGHHNALITEQTRPVPPSGSTLPRLAAEIDVPLLLLDPSHGAVGLRQQVAEAVQLLEVDAVHIVDIGGDILAVGDEPDLRSPLADTLALCACLDLTVPVDVLVAGAGLDGELHADYIRQRVDELKGRTIGRVTEDHTHRASTLLEWHPSEATALLTAAAQGLLGTVELRDRGTPLTIDEDSPLVYCLDLIAVRDTNRLAATLCKSTSLDAAENIVLGLCGSSEIDYERSKQDQIDRSPSPSSPIDPRRIRAFLLEANERGVDYVTVRRVAEAVDARSVDVETMRTVLRQHDARGDSPPLWRTLASA